MPSILPNGSTKMASLWIIPWFLLRNIPSYFLCIADPGKISPWDISWFTACGVCTWTYHNRLLFLHKIALITPDTHLSALIFLNLHHLQHSKGFCTSRVYLNELRCIVVYCGVPCGVLRCTAVYRVVCCGVPRGVLRGVVYPHLHHYNSFTP